MSGAKPDPDTTATADTEGQATTTHSSTNTKSQARANLVRQPATVTTQEKLSVLKCTNKEEAIAYEKHLRKLAENAIHCLQEQLNAEPDAPILGEMMPMLIKDFKKTVAEMYNLVHHANRKEILKSINDPEGECLWNPGDDDDGQEAPAQATVQQEKRDHPKAEDFIQAWD